MSATTLMHVAGWVRWITIVASLSVLVPLGWGVIPWIIDESDMTFDVAGVVYVVFVIVTVYLMTILTSRWYWRKVRERRELTRAEKKTAN
ncbi:MAG: hypothetical protein AAFX52_00280 [Pseudomonadota bacterium]